MALETLPTRRRKHEKELVARNLSYVGISELLIAFREVKSFHFKSSHFLRNFALYVKTSSIGKLFLCCLKLNRWIMPEILDFNKGALRKILFFSKK